MLKQILILTYRFYYIVWHDLFTNPFRIYYKSYTTLRSSGIQELVTHLNHEYLTLKLRHKIGQNYKYDKWIKQNEKNIYKTDHLRYKPLVSIVTPVFNTNPYFLIEMIQSVLSQTYLNWEFCIAEDVSTSTKIKEVLSQYVRLHNNIKIIYREYNGHISTASNSALSLATGEFIVFLDHDDMLAPNALYEMVKKLNQKRNLKLIYSDEDKINSKGKRFDPHFKSAWNPDLFYSQNYISHLVCIKKNIVDKIGGFRVEYEGSQDYDLLLRSLQHINNDEIDRIEKILYHWRAIKGSTALSSGEKNHTTQAGMRALKNHFSKIVNVHEIVQEGLLPNTYKVNYPLPQKTPLVTLLIPTRDGYNILFKCIESILDKTTYKNYEIIILDNQTTDHKTLEYFKYLAKYSNVSIVKYNHPFNYSAINNFGVKHAKGEILGLINNDVEVISKHWLTEMVQHALRPAIGAVGAKLYYDNDTIQHAGVILGIGGVAGHSHKYFPKDAHGYFSRLKVIQNLSAVTGACLVVRKSLYLEVGGLDEEHLTVAFNDVDFCLKLQEKGYRNVWTPYAELYHHESISRGPESDNTKRARFQKEINFMQNKWKSKLKADKYYNINLTSKNEDFKIKV